MDNMTATSPTTDDAPAHEALVEYYIAGMKRLQEQMASDREEILTLQAETRAILDDVMVLLNAA